MKLCFYKKIISSKFSKIFRRKKWLIVKIMIIVDLRTSSRLIRVGYGESLLCGE
jgi:hypothetical protein